VSPGEAGDKGESFRDGGRSEAASDIAVELITTPRLHGSLGQLGVTLPCGMQRRQNRDWAQSHDVFGSCWCGSPIRQSCRKGIRARVRWPSCLDDPGQEVPSLSSHEIRPTLTGLGDQNVAGTTRGGGVHGGVANATAALRSRQQRPQGLESAWPRE
jgi:hypothetical protein